MKRILFIHHAHERTGACITLTHALRALDRGRFEPVVVCPPGDSVAMFRATGAEVHLSARPMRIVPHVSGYSFRPWSRAFIGGALGQRLDRAYWRRIVEAQRADIVHLNSLTLAPLARAVRDVGVPVVCLVQETFAKGLLGLRTSWLKRTLSTELDGVWFISEHDRRAARSAAPVVEVIPNWANFDNTADADSARTAFGLDSAARVVLFMGGVSQQKGTLTLLRALERVHTPQTVLLLAGDRPEAVSDAVRREVSKLLERLSTSERVRLLGRVTDVGACYAAADVVVFCPSDPHQGRPILEAALMSKPVVASEFDCVREFVAHGRNGLLVPPGDAEALAGALDTLLADPVRARAMGAANRAVAMANHDARTNGARMNAFYERVLQTARSSRVDRRDDAMLSS
jgi:glycosyltransferase involved in cell wall biosynthesis